MNETKKGGQYTGQELAVLLRASIKMGTLMRQHREFLINVLANYMGEQEHAQLVRLLNKQYEEMSKQCAQATWLLEREHARQQRTEEEEQAHGQ
ncbi:hypothetical protein [uncultured Rothia sp.]|uniref:hypothetical protein n=1 Tax=uncultured Rothia sp. TaxID=316088 RepID=UPI00261FD155|nr:hypothetical protein [uncultured Rothia sp.]